MPGSLENILNTHISVVTASEVRYDGILRSFDREGPTVTLSDVRLIGTENRPATQKVMPSDKIYSFMVFRADLLKKMTTQDPAIVTVGDDSLERPSNRHINFHPAIPSGRSTKTSMNSRPISLRELRQGSDNRSGSRRQPSMRQQSGQRRQQPHHEQHSKRQSSKPARRVSFKESDSDRVIRDLSKFSHVPHIPKSMISRFSKKTDSHSGSRKSAKRVVPGEFAKPKTALVMFDEDFDFEKAQEKFQELRIADQKPEDSQAETGEAPCYDRNESFYDQLTISPENDGKKRTRKDESEANRQTFGTTRVPGTRNWGQKRRFRGRRSLSAN